MATPPVSLYLRIAGTPSFGLPVINAGTIAPPSFGGTSYMQYPAGQGDLIWQGAEFGFTAPGGSGAQVQAITFSVNHRVSVASAFSTVQARVYAGSTPVGSPFPLTLSISYVTDTFTLSTGYAASQLPNLALRVTYHAVAPSLAFVNSVSASASYSFPSAITPFTIAGTSSFPAPQPSVLPLPFVSLVALGAESASLSPSFAQSVGAGNLAVGWVFSNSGSGTFDTTISDPTWTLAGVAGGAFSWLSMWYKLACPPGQAAPSFTTPASVPMSQLAEFTGKIVAFDHAGTGAADTAVTATSGAADTASGDLLVTAVTWLGTNTGPTTITLAADDSAGNTVPLSVADNASSSGSQFWAFGWGQAGQAFAPLADTATGTLGVFAGGRAVTASFIADATPKALPSPLSPVRAQRTVTIPIRAGW